MATQPTRDQYIRLQSNLWLQRSEDGLRHAAIFKMQHATSGRGSDIREVEMADRFAWEYDMKPVPAPAVITIKQNGKTNQVSRGYC